MYIALIMSVKQRGSKRLEKTLRERIRARGENACQSCGVEQHLEPLPDIPDMEPSYTGTVLHVHRIVPGDQGGLYSMENCVLLCPRCHFNHHGWFSGWVS